MKFKVCPKCNEPKPEMYFYTNTSWCKSCRKNAQKKAEYGKDPFNRPDNLKCDARVDELKLKRELQEVWE